MNSQKGNLKSCIPYYTTFLSDLQRSQISNNSYYSHPFRVNVVSYYYVYEESVIIKIIVIILKEKPWNNFDYSPKGATVKKSV